MSRWKLGLYHRRILESGHDCAPGQRVIPTWEFYRQDYRKRFRREDVCDFALDCAAPADWMKHNPGRRLSERPGRPVLPWTIRPLPADFWQLLCGACNSVKGNRTQEYLIAALRKSGVIR